MKKRRGNLKSTLLSGLGLVSSSSLSKYAELNGIYNDGALTPAPEWLQNADMIVNPKWYYMTWDLAINPNKSNSPWDGYELLLKDVTVERRVRVEGENIYKETTEKVLSVVDGTFNGAEFEGVPLLSHVPVSEAAFRQAKAQGFRSIPYVHFTDIHSFYADQDVFMFEHPDILLKDKDGNWVHMPMGGNDRLHRYMTCANTQKYLDFSLAYIKKLMDWGADGIFIDNVITYREECYAKEEDHKHMYPGATANEVFSRFLESVRTLVKSYGEDKIVLINSGYRVPEYARHADCCMLESWLYAKGYEGRRTQHTWPKNKKIAKDLKWYIEDGDRRLTCLSQVDSSRIEVKEDAYWAFCSARLLDFIWWCSNLKGTGAEHLYKTHMGKSLQQFQEADQVAYRAFENGVIVLNDNSQDKTKTLNLPSNFKHNQLLDLFDGKKKVEVHNGQITVIVPKESARIYFAS